MCATSGTSGAGEGRVGGRRSATTEAATGEELVRDVDDFEAFEGTTAAEGIVSAVLHEVLDQVLDEVRR